MPKYIAYFEVVKPFEEIIEADSVEEAELEANKIADDLTNNLSICNSADGEYVRFIGC